MSYSTFNLNGEARIQPNLRKSDMMGIGLMFNSDKAGDARYGTNQAYLSGSLMRYLKHDSSLIGSFGMNVGFCNVGFDYTKMTFDNQYSDDSGFNKGLPTGEVFGRSQTNFADLSLGLAIQYTYKHIHRFTYALGTHHLSRPSITYQGSNLSKLDIKMTNCFAYSCPISTKTDIIGEALVTLQGKNYELIPHASFKFYSDRSENRAVSVGACYRARDAIIFRMGYDFRTLQSGISYDINISKFTAATNRRGAFEIFVNYIIKKGPGFVARKRSCPAFM